LGRVGSMQLDQFSRRWLASLSNSLPDCPVLSVAVGVGPRIFDQRHETRSNKNYVNDVDR